MRSTGFCTRQSAALTTAARVVLFFAALTSTTNLLAATSSAAATLHITLRVAPSINSPADVPIRQNPTQAEGIIYNLEPEAMQNGTAEVAAQEKLAPEQQRDAVKVDGDKDPAVLRVLTFVTQ